MKDTSPNDIVKKKMRKFLLSTVPGNFVGFVAATFVTTFTTYHSYERRALKNLFGILPREKVEVHIMPEWLEWFLAVMLGFIIMEVVNYFISTFLLRKIKKV